MLLKNNATTSLVIKGEKQPIDNTNTSNRPLTQFCELSLANSSIDASILVALREGISFNKSLKSLKLSGLNFTIANNNTDDNHNDKDNNSTVDDGEDYEWCKSLINKTTLQNLDLSGSRLSASTVTNLSNALFLNTSLQSLDLSRCCLDDQSLSKVLTSVKEHPGLTKLNVSGNFLGKSASTSAVDAVAELLRSNSSKLACLDLSQQQQQPLSEPRRQALESADSLEERVSEKESHQIAFTNALNALSTNTTLRRIDLSGNSSCLADLTSVKAFSSCLLVNAALIHVDVSSCHLTSIGIEYLAQHCIPRCSPKLKSLILFGDESSKNCMAEAATSQASLYSALQSNRTLENLGELDDSKIQHSLNLNRAGSRSLATDDLPLAAWSHVLARAGHIEYNNDNDFDNGNDDTSGDKIESITNATTASVLFALLQGPALLETRCLIR